MGDEPLALSLGLTEAGEGEILLGARGTAADLPTLLHLAPELATPDHATKLARAVNHLARGKDYDVIDSPPAFAAAYRARLAAEAPEAEWQEGVPRLSDYGVPDFTQITPPALSDHGLRFFAVDSFLGLPYRVEVMPLEAAPSYTPLPLTPLPGRAPAPAPAPAAEPETEDDDWPTAEEAAADEAARVTETAEEPPLQPDRIGPMRPDA